MLRARREAPEGDRRQPGDAAATPQSVAAFESAVESVVGAAGDRSSSRRRSGARRSAGAGYRATTRCSGGRRGRARLQAPCSGRSSSVSTRNALAEDGVHVEPRPAPARAAAYAERSAACRAVEAPARELSSAWNPSPAPPPIASGGRQRTASCTPPGQPRVSRSDPPGHRSAAKPRRSCSRPATPPCFANAAIVSARKLKLDPAGLEVEAKVDLGRLGDGAFGLGAELEMTAPQLTSAEAQAVIEAAHERCPIRARRAGNSRGRARRARRHAAPRPDQNLSA